MNCTCTLGVLQPNIHKLQQHSFSFSFMSMAFKLPLSPFLIRPSSIRTTKGRSSLLTRSYNLHSKTFLSDDYGLFGHSTQAQRFTDFPSFVIYTLSRRRSEKVALVDGISGRQLTFQEVEQKMVILANALDRMRIQQGQVVMILAPNSVYYPVVLLAISYLGAVVATPNPLGTPEDVHHQIALTNVKLVITTRELLFKIRDLNLPTILIDCDDSDESTILPHFCDDESHEKGLELLSEILKDSSSHAGQLKRVGIQLDDPAAILYSSGTTGMSKAVVLSHKNIIAQILQMSTSLKYNQSLDRQDVHLCALPMSHIFGSVVVTLQQLYCGNKTVVLRGFELRGILAAIHHHRISHIYVVPPVIVSLVKSLQKNGSSKYNLDSLRSILCGAAPLGKELIDTCYRLFPNISFLQLYGLTEVTGGCTLNRTVRTTPDSVGKLLSDMEARVIDVQTGELLSPHQQGELLLRGPTTMIGYMNDLKATNMTLDSEGWLCTGDLVYFDELGNLYVVDRIKELIKYKAMQVNLDDLINEEPFKLELQVAPAELEALLLSHPFILDAAVVPYRTQDVGEIPMAFVVPSLDGNLTEDDVKAFVAKHVAPYKRVRRVAFTNAIPKTASGKILRKELVKQLI